MKLFGLGGPSGHRKDSANDSGRAGAVPAGPSRERAGGTEPQAGARISPEPVNTEVLAWRGWGFEPSVRRLKSVTAGHIWQGPTFVSDERPDTVRGPYSYQYHEPGVHALQEDKFRGSGYDLSEVIGEVALTGLVVVGTFGWRAEKATIRSLVVRPGLCTAEKNTLDVIDELAAVYQCEVTISGDPIVGQSAPNPALVIGNLFQQLLMQTAPKGVPSYGPSIASMLGLKA